MGVHLSTPLILRRDESPNPFPPSLNRKPRERVDPPFSFSLSAGVGCLNKRLRVTGFRQDTPGQQGAGYAGDGRAGRGAWEGGMGGEEREGANGMAPEQVETERNQREKGGGGLDSHLVRPETMGREGKEGELTFGSTFTLPTAILKQRI